MKVANKSKLEDNTQPNLNPSDILTLATIQATQQNKPSVAGVFKSATNTPAAEPQVSATPITRNIETVETPKVEKAPKTKIVDTDVTPNKVSLLSIFAGKTSEATGGSAKHNSGKAIETPKSVTADAKHHGQAATDKTDREKNQNRYVGGQKAVEKEQTTPSDMTTLISKDIAKDNEQQREAYKALLDKYPKFESWVSAADQKDFAEKSKYNQQYDSSKVNHDAFGNVWYSENDGDLLYDYINGNSDAVTITEAMQRGAKTYAKWQNLPQETKDTFNYIYATEGKDAAYDYMQMLEDIGDVSPSHLGTEAIAYGFMQGSGALSTAFAIGSAINPEAASAVYTDISKEAAESAQQYKGLYNVGNIAGNVALMTATGAGVEAAGSWLGKIPGVGKWASNAIVKAAAKSGATMGTTRAISEAGATATGQQTVGKYVQNIVKSTLAGAAGGATAQTTAKLLTALGSKHVQDLAAQQLGKTGVLSYGEWAKVSLAKSGMLPAWAAYTNSVLSGVGFAGADALTTYLLSEDGSDDKTTKAIVDRMVSAFLFSTISSGMNLLGYADTYNTALESEVNSLKATANNPIAFSQGAAVGLGQKVSDLSKAAAENSSLKTPAERAEWVRTELLKEVDAYIEYVAKQEEGLTATGRLYGDVEKSIYNTKQSLEIMREYLSTVSGESAVEWMNASADAASWVNDTPTLLPENASVAPNAPIVPTDTTTPIEVNTPSDSISNINNNSITLDKSISTDGSLGALGADNKELPQYVPQTQTIPTEAQTAFQNEMLSKYGENASVPAETPTTPEVLAPAEAPAPVVPEQSSALPQYTPREETTPTPEQTRIGNELLEQYGGRAEENTPVAIEEDKALSELSEEYSAEEPTPTETPATEASTEEAQATKPNVFTKNADAPAEPELTVESTRDTPFKAKGYLSGRGTKYTASGGVTNRDIWHTAVDGIDRSILSEEQAGIVDEMSDNLNRIDALQERYDTLDSRIKEIRSDLRDFQYGMSDELREELTQELNSLIKERTKVNADIKNTEKALLDFGDTEVAKEVLNRAREIATAEAEARTTDNVIDIYERKLEQAEQAAEAAMEKQERGLIAEKAKAEKAAYAEGEYRGKLKQGFTMAKDVSTLKERIKALKLQKEQQIENLRNLKNQKIEQTERAGKEKLAEYKEKQKVKEIRGKISSAMDDMRKLISRPGKTSSKHAPPEMMGALADFCEMFNENERQNLFNTATKLSEKDAVNAPGVVSSTSLPEGEVVGTYDPNEEAYWTIQDGKVVWTHDPLPTPEEADALDAKIWNKEDKVLRQIDALNKLSDEYKRISEDPDYGDECDQHLAEHIEDIHQLMSEKTIQEMTSKELQEVYNVVKEFRHQMTYANQTIAHGKHEQLDALVRKMGQQIKDTAIPETGIGRQLDSYITWQQSPDTFWDALTGYAKDGVGPKIQEKFVAGQERALEVQKAYRETMRAIADAVKNFPKDLTPDENGEIPVGSITAAQAENELRKMLTAPLSNLTDWGLTTKSGKPFETPRDMMLEAYLLLKQPDSFRKILYGGLQLPRLKDFYAGNEEKSYSYTVEEDGWTDGIAIPIERLDSEISAAKRELRSPPAVQIENRIEYLKSEQERLTEAEPEVLSNISGEIAALEELLERSKATDDQTEIKNDALYQKIQDAQWQKIDTLESEKTDLIEAKTKELEQLISNIEEQLTDFDRLIIDTARKWFDVSGEYRDEADMENFGYKGSHPENYYPIHSSADQRKQDFSTTNNNKAANIENTGSRQTRTGSREGIRLGGLFSTLDKSAADTAKIFGFMGVQRDLNRMLNMRYSDDSPITLAGLIKQFGGDNGNAYAFPAAMNYIENYIKAVAGGSNNAGGFFSAIYNNMAGASLSMNPVAAIPQIASIPTSSAEVGWDSMAEGFAKALKDGAFTKKYRDQLAEDNVWYWTRTRGTGSIPEISEFISQRGLRGALFNSKLGKAITNWCQMMDAVATAVEYPMAQVAAKKQGFEPGTDEYYEEVSRIYRDVLRKTQPNYTTTERSDFLRDRRNGVRIFNMFKTQSNQNANMLMDAHGRLKKAQSDFKEGKNGVNKEDVAEAKKKWANTLTAVLMGGNGAFAVLRTLMQTLLGEVRDEDKEVTAAAVGTRLVKNYFSALTSMYAFGGEVFNAIWSIVSKDTYYAPEDSAMQAVANAAEQSVKFIQKALDSDKKITVDDIIKEFKYVGNLTGIPFSSATRLGKAADMWVKDLYGGTFGRFEGGIERTKTEEMNRLINGFLAGNAAKADRALAGINTLYEGDETAISKAIASAASKRLKAGEITEEQYRDIVGKYTEQTESKTNRRVAEATYKDWNRDESGQLSMTDVALGIAADGISDDDAERIWSEEFGYSGTYADYVQKNQERFDALDRLTAAGVKVSDSNNLDAYFKNPDIAEDSKDDIITAYAGKNTAKGYNAFRELGLTAEESYNGARVIDANSDGDLSAIEAAMAIESAADIMPGGMSNEQAQQFFSNFSNEDWGEYSANNAEKIDAHLKLAEENVYPTQSNWQDYLQDDNLSEDTKSNVVKAFAPKSVLKGYEAYTSLGYDAFDAVHKAEMFNFDSKGSVSNDDAALAILEYGLVGEERDALWAAYSSDNTEKDWDTYYAQEEIRLNSRLRLYRAGIDATKSNYTEYLSDPDISDKMKDNIVLAYANDTTSNAYAAFRYEGISPSKAYAIVEATDADGNGQITQKEVIQATAGLSDKDARAFWGHFFEASKYDKAKKNNSK